jgi:predicted nuclease with TOPRIM domain
MSYSNYPSTGGQQTPPSSKDNRKLIYGLLIAALLGTWAYIIFDKNKTNETVEQMQAQIVDTDSARSQIESEYNDALSRMDSLIGNNTQLQGELAQRKTEIDELKNKIRTELKKKDGDLSKARQMISELNSKISDLLTQVEVLTKQNSELTASNEQLNLDKQTITAEKQAVENTLATTQAEKARVEDVGSTLSASNINITSLNVKNSGKEKTTDKAKRVDVFRISFDLNENRISPSGTKEIYVCMYGPDGNPITMPENGSGNFSTREEGDKVYTNKVAVQYEQGRRTPVSFDWAPEGGKYQEGSYTIKIYQNGYKIGEGKKTLRKSGLFS